MACSTKITGIANSCKDNTGGLKEVYIAAYDDIASVEVDPDSNTISEITMESEGKFRVFQFRKNTATFTETSTVDDAAGTIFVQSDLALQFSKVDAAKRLEIQALVEGDVVVIVRDNNEVLHYLGYDNTVTSTAASGEFGTAMGDFSGYKVTLSDFSRKFPHIYAPKDIATFISILDTDVPHLRFPGEKIV